MQDGVESLEVEGLKSQDHLHASKTTVSEFIEPSTVVFPLATYLPC